jgi:hypothetical protein
MPRHGLVLVMVTKVQCLQVLGLMMGGVMEFQGLRDGQGWTWSKPNFSMGTNLACAHKVFV